MIESRVIGEVFMVRAGVVLLQVRAEGPGIIGDLVEELLVEDVVARGWRTERPVAELKPGESTAVLASD